MVVFLALKGGRITNTDQGGLTNIEQGMTIGEVSGNID